MALDRKQLFEYIIDTLDKSLQQRRESDKQSMQEMLEDDENILNHYESATENEMADFESKTRSLDYLASCLDTIDELASFENTASKIGRGTVVETKEFIFVVGTSLPSFSFENKKVVGIAPDAPIYESLMEKEVGAMLQLGKIEEEILHIY